MKRLLFLLLVLCLPTVVLAQSYSDNVQLTIDSTAGGVSFTATDIRSGNGHPQVNSASCTNNSSGGAFRYTVDGSAPTTTVGVEVPEGGALVFNSTQALLNFKAIRTGGSSAVLSCTFSQLSNLPPVYPVGAGGGGGGSVSGDVNITEVGGVTVSTANLPVDCVVGCAAATSDADDGSIATGQTNSNANALTMAYDGSVWRRVTFGTAGTASTQVSTVQGIAGMTPILATVSDGAGALNTIVDSGTLTAVTTITNPVTVTDGAGALNTIVDSGTLTAVTTVGTITNSVAVTNAGLTELAAAINSNLVDVNIVSGAGSGGTALADDADFTAGTTNFTPVGGFYQSLVTACTDGDTCAAGITTGRAVKAALANADGSLVTYATDATVGEVALTTGPQFLCYSNTSAPSAVTAGDAQYVWCDGSGRPIMVGAGTAGTATGGVVTVQGVASMTPVQVSQATAANLNGTVIGPVAHDAAASGVNPNLVGGYASATVPTAVSTATDSVRAWYTLNGAAVTTDIDPCSRGTKVYVAISQATSTELFTGTASSRTFVCSVSIIQKAASTQTWSLVSGTGTVCATSTSAMIGATTAANGTDLSVTQGNGASTFLKTDTDADSVCLLQSSTDRINGWLTYVVSANQ